MAERNELYSVEELLSKPAFRLSFIKASQELAVRRNTINIITPHILLEILSELKEIKTTLRRQAEIPETEEEREVRIDKEIDKANKVVEEEIPEEELTEEEMEFNKETNINKKRIKRLPK